MKILICGDFTTCGKGLDSVKKRSALDESILQFIREADVSIVNLECPVADVSDPKIEKSGPSLRTDANTVSYLKKCGFTHVTLANNHFYDYADIGVEKTITAIEKEGIGFVGGGRTPDEIRKPIYIEAEVIKLAILNYCEHEFSVHSPMGSNPLNPITAYYDIKTVKEKCDHLYITNQKNGILI